MFQSNGKINFKVFLKKRNAFFSIKLIRILELRSKNIIGNYIYFYNLYVYEIHN